jgi:uncharacterized membrane protein
MHEVPVTWPRVFSVLWLLFWRGMLGSVIIGTLVGLVIGFAFGVVNVMSGTRSELNPLVPGIPSAIAGLLWYLAVVRMALEKQYKEFRISLVSRST